MTSTHVRANSKRANRKCCKFSRTRRQTALLFQHGARFEAFDFRRHSPWRRRHCASGGRCGLPRLANPRLRADDGRQGDRAGCRAKKARRHGPHAEIWTTAQAVIRSAAEAGQFDLAIGLISKSDKSYHGVDAGPLFVAMKLAGREKDFSSEMAQNRSFDKYMAPALVASGRDADFAELVKSRKLDGYDLAGMQMAGDLMAGQRTRRSPSLRPLRATIAPTR